MSDKLNKNINESMLEGLLSDEDKPKPPPKAVTPSYYRGGTQGRLPYGSSYYDDEEYDRPIYNPSGRSTYVPPRSAAPTSYSAGFDISAATINAIKMALAGGIHSGQKHYFMPAKDADLLANAMVRAIGELMDKVGLTFGASGSKAAKALVVDMLATNMFYNTPSRGFKELDFGDADAATYDPETGELLSEDVDVERAAIMEVDGGEVDDEEM